LLSWVTHPFFLRLSSHLIYSGHSERRTIFLETSEVVAKKTKAAIASHLKVILCIGETLAEREAGKTKQVCEAQLKAVVDVLETDDWRCDLLPQHNSQCLCFS
jgi:triosephosphate isomerase